MKIKIGIAKLFDDAISSVKEAPRDYLGASCLGDECDRAIWFQFKGVEQDTIKSSTRKKFELGKIYEDLTIRILKEIPGIKVFDKDSNGEQFGFDGGIIKGHIDGVISGLPESLEPHLLEVKALGHSLFEQIRKLGLKIAMPKYWAQIQIYMKFMGLKRCLFIMWDKSNEEVEFIRFSYNVGDSEYYLGRAIDITNMKNIPHRLSESPTFFKCKMCFYYSRCHGNSTGN